MCETRSEAETVEPENERMPVRCSEIESAQEGIGIMTGLTRWDPLKGWDPFKEVRDLQNRLSSLFSATPLQGADGKEETMTVAEWSPRVDICEDEREYSIRAELPGLKKEEVKVTVENGVLSISGERKYEKEDKNRKYHRIERAYGNFLRSFSIPDDADASKVSAEFKDGVLDVHLAKDEKAKPKAIEVKVA
jgi:HSP20 family protein